MIFCVNTASADPGVIYVNGTGNDAYDGQSPVYDSITGSGPKQTIGNAANTVTAGGTVHIADGTYKGNGNRGITINKNMNIIGESQVGTIIDAEKWNTIFTVNSGVTLSLQNLTLENGNTYIGGAIRNYGTLNVSDSTFTGNLASYGGAIHNDGYLTVTDSAFTSNTAYINGGAIASNIDTNLTITNCAFTNNIASSYDGGAILNDGNMTVTNSTFTNNSSNGHGYGGAIANNWYDIDITVTNCTFTNNHANDIGGAISNAYGNNLAISNSTFNNNSARNYGGAIYNSVNCTVSDSTFTGNSAYYSGGAIYNNGSLTINDSVFNSNTTTSDGGAIENRNNLQVTGTTFINNTATGTFEDEGTIYNSSVGGAVHNYSGSASFSDCSFINNMATLRGGAIDNYSTLTINSCTFRGNSSEYGGAILDWGTLHMHYSRLVGNTADNGSGIYWYNGTCDATLNWWGSNADPKTTPNLIVGDVIADPWMILTVNASPNSIYNTGATSKITVDLLHDSTYNPANPDASYHAPIDGHVPDGLPVTFTSPAWGTLTDIDPSDIKTLNGKVEATFNDGTSNPPTSVTIYAAVDGYTESTIINLVTIPTTTSVNSTNNYAGKPVTINAQVKDNQNNPLTAGQVQFIIGTTTIGTADITGGTASYIWTIPANWTKGPYTITANYLGSTNYSPSTATGTLTVDPSANLYFKKAVSNGTHYYGDTIHYYLKVVNNGPDNAADVTVLDKLPAGLIFKSANTTMGSYNLSTNTWTIGTLKAGQTAKLDIKAVVNKVGTIKNSATLNYSTYPANPETKTSSFTVPLAVTIPQLITASAQIKSYAETHNYKLPSSLKVAGQTLTMPQLLRILVIATIHINQKNYKPISVKDVGKAPYPNGYTSYGNLYTKQYLTVASNINKFIKNNGRAPNYASTSLGKVPFTRLVYMYAKIVKFYGQKHRLPHYVVTYKI